MITNSVSCKRSISNELDKEIRPSSKHEYTLSLDTAYEALDKLQDYKDVREFWAGIRSLQSARQEHGTPRQAGTETLPSNDL
jgi:hypothetical protein